LLVFYQFQLGTYVYLVLDLLVLDYKRYATKNFGELFFHHFVTILLIAFSLSYNLMPIGITILFVHDSSDILRGFSCTLGDSWACVLYPWATNSVNYLYLALWVYARLLVLPFCLLESFYTNIPSQAAEWSFLKLQFGYLLMISCAIYSIQCYWSYFMFKRMKKENAKNAIFVKWHQEGQAWGRKEK
jgi:hypothetical protein